MSPIGPSRPRLDLDLDDRGLRPGAAGVFSRNTLAFPHLEALLGVASVASFPSIRDADGLAFVVGWGDKPSAARPRAFAEATGVPFVAAEDGFLRSVGNHRIKPPPLSLVLDDEGIYYRAATPSRLERLIADTPAIAAATTALAAAALERVRGEKLTKYNTFAAPGGGAGDAATGAPDGPPIRLLLVDQVFGDQSIAGGLADPATFVGMVEAALAEVPAADIAVKVHPDVIAGRARGYLLDVARARGLAIVADAGNPFDLLERVERVFTVSSQLGFEALIAGRPVACFGVPFYAGWGLTDDRPGGAAAPAALARRRAAAPGGRTLVEIFAAAYVRYPRYADPVTAAALDIGAAIDRLLEWRDALAVRRRPVAITGRPPFDARLAEAAFGGAGAPVVVGEDAPAAAPPATTAAGRTAPLVLAWSDAPPIAGSTVGPGPLRDDRLTAAWGFDGSVAISDGVPMTAVLSIATATPGERAEARAVVEALAAAPFARLGTRLEPGGDREATEADRPGVVAVVLPAVATPADAAVVAAARRRHPSAPLLVVREVPRPTGPSRRSRLAAVAAARRAPLPPSRRREATSPLAAAAGRLLAVHVVDSELAYDALSGGLPVFVHGRPDFAGWGPTEDVLPLARPCRHDLETLVALAIVRGGRHVDPASGLPARPSERLAAGARVAAGAPVGPDPGLLAALDGLERRIKAGLKRPARR